ncbi:nuclear transport factor 2 family protein [Ralstonia wenshanensis]|uniref:nuclear transport factor 2 family protein n=1 Tax=Ralstonia wenshanensis TaxID=2842456 RepID=UPI002AAED1CF|nr:nuclear transport factor 2 family protein [Ralstonia wenshanensis]MDY7511235.1 nuclear transport factor 2 family protein [Ralstonia wenshanensis]
MSTRTPSPYIDEDHRQILELLQVYLDALYDGDVRSLKSVFQPNALLFAEVRGEIVQKTLDVYLDGVANRESPASRNDPYGMSILSVEVIGKIAMAKVRVKVTENNYLNLLSLLKIGREWRIVNKLFTHVVEPVSP